jgi:hypothetical protein
MGEISTTHAFVQLCIWKVMYLKIALYLESVELRSKKIDQITLGSVACD